MRWFEQLRATSDLDSIEPIGDFIDSGDRVAVRYVWRALGQEPRQLLRTAGASCYRQRSKGAATSSPLAGQLDVARGCASK
jgi:hypothetical protein